MLVFCDVIIISHFSTLSSIVELRKCSVFHFLCVLWRKLLLYSNAKFLKHFILCVIDVIFLQFWTPYNFVAITVNSDKDIGSFFEGVGVWGPGQELL